MKAAAVAACVTTSLAGPFALRGLAATRPVPPASPPNIVLILADDVGYGELSCYGETRYATPTIDALARSGIRFTDFYAAPECTPSRCCLMTGRDPGHARLRANFGITATGEKIRASLLPQDLTIAEILHRSGYVTGCVGKWGLGELGSPGMPWKQGFDYFYGFLDDARAHNYYPPSIVRNGQAVTLTRNLHGRGEYIDDDFMREAQAFMDRNRSRPFFLYLPLTLPHGAFVMPDDARRGIPLNLSDGFPPGKVWPTSPIFAAMMRRLDQDVGRVLGRIKELGLTGRTLVVFASDNGAAYLGHGLDDSIDAKFFKASGPLRGFKGDVYDGGIRVPFIASWPGHITPGRVSHVPLAVWDVLPTLAAVAGVPPPPDIQGISFLPALLGKSQRTHPWLYWEFVKDGQPRQAVRLGRWKADRYGFDGPIQLYDLATDIGERRDVAASHPKVVARIEAIMREDHVPSPLYRLRQPKRPLSAAAK